MPEIFRHRGYRFFFYSNEGTEPPHVHVEYDRSTAKFWLRNVSLARHRRFADHRLTEVQSLIEEHQTELLKAWHDHFSGR